MRFTRLALAFVATIVFTSLAHAQTTWTGSNGGLWSTPTNWSNGVPNSNTAIFNNALNTTNTNDIATVTLTGMQFAVPAASFNINGNAIGFTNSSSITNTSTNAQTINNNIVGNNILNINGGSAGVTLNGVVSGATLLNITGGVLTLNGTNTYTGGTLNLASTLIVGNNSALGTGSFTASNSIFAANTNVTLANDVFLAGTNFIASTSSNTITLTGTVTGTGQATITNGTTLVVNNTNNTWTGTTTVLQGTLRGIGAVGPVLNSTNGIVAPGNGSLGALTVNGNYLQPAGTLAIRVSSTSNDRLIVTGSSAITGGNIAVNLASPLYPFAGFTIVTATNGLTFSQTNVTVTDSSAIVGFTATSIGNTVQLIARTDTNGVLAAAQGSNNQAMALSLLSEIAADGSNPRLLELTQLNGTQLNTVLSQLSPERLQAIAHSTVFSVQAFNDALFASAGAAGQSGVTAGLIDPMRGGLASVAQDPALLASVVQSGGVAATAPASPFQLFGRGYGIFNKSDSSDNHTGYNADSAGGLFGAQFAFGNELAAGIAVGYNHTHIDFDSSLGTEKDDALRVGPFVTTHLGGFNIESAVTWGYHWTKMETTNFFGAADGDFNAWDITAFGRVGYDFNLEGTLKLTPFAAAQYVYYRQDSFNETGAGGLVHVDANTFDSLRTYLGARLAFTTHMGGMSIIPEVSAAWAHEFLGDNDSISGSFIGGGTPFSVNTTGIDKDSVVAGGGVTALLNDTVSVFVRYDGDFGSNHEIHTVTGGVGIRF